VNATLDQRPQRIVYWHRDLPPIEAELVDEHTVEASSGRVSGRIVHPDDLWHRCHGELMAAAESRVRQEVSRLRGDFAHIYEESIAPRHDDTTGQGWLYGRFNYVLYRRPAARTGRASRG
jgi:hypothetical protein